jgi:periplasmic divalent cation tolerance protein
MESRFVQVITTTQTKEEAERIARTLVEHKLAACVQVIGPICSVFRWKEAVESASEWLCCAKTIRDVLGAVQEMIRTQHSYEVPEFVVLPILDGSADYLAWLSAQVSPP